MTTNDAYSNERAKKLMDAWAQSQVKFWENWLGSSQAIPTTTVEAEPIEEAQDTRDTMLDKEVVLRFLELSQMAWKDLLALAASQHNLQVAEPSKSSVRQPFSNPTTKPSRDAAELWLMYLQGMQKWGQFAASSTFPSLPPVPAKSDRPELNDLASLYQNLYQKSLSSFLTSGLPGSHPDLNKQLLQGFYVWSSMYKATLEYQLAIAQIWTNAFEKMTES